MELRLFPSPQGKPQTVDSNFEESRPRQQVVFRENPRVSPSLITTYPDEGEDDRSSLSSDDDNLEEESATDLSDVIRCVTNKDATLVLLNKQHDSAAIKEHLEESCLARNLCSPDVVLQITDRRLLQFLPAATILKSAKKLGRITAASDPTVNQHYTNLISLPICKSQDLLLCFYKKFFATIDESPLQLDPEGSVLAYFHPDYQLGDNTDAMAFFDSDPFDIGSVQAARDKVMRAVQNLIPVFTYLMWPAWEALISELSQLVNGRMIPDFLYPPSYVVHHLHSLFARFGMVARHRKTARRWSEARLRKQFRKLVTRPFAEEDKANAFYTAISQYRLGGQAPLSIGRKPKRDGSSNNGSGGAPSKKPKAIRKKGQPKTAPQPLTGVPSTQAGVTTPAIANPPSNPPVQPSASPVTTYCKLHLLEVLGLVNTSSMTPYKCNRSFCSQNNNITHTLITVDALSNRKQIEDFMASPVSVATWHDRTTVRQSTLQYQKVMAFAATRP